MMEQYLINDDYFALILAVISLLISIVSLCMIVLEVQALKVRLSRVESRHEKSRWR